MTNPDGSRLPSLCKPTTSTASLARLLHGAELDPARKEQRQKINLVPNGRVVELPGSNSRCSISSWDLGLLCGLEDAGKPGPSDEKPSGSSCDSGPGHRTRLFWRRAERFRDGDASGRPWSSMPTVVVTVEGVDVYAPGGLPGRCVS